MHAYFDHQSLGSHLKIVIVGDIAYHNRSISLAEWNGWDLTENTNRLLEETGANLVHYMVGKKVMMDDGEVDGISGCIGCLCFPKENRTRKPNRAWKPKYDTNQKHSLSAKERSPLKQAWVR